MLASFLLLPLLALAAPTPSPDDTPEPEAAEVATPALPLRWRTRFGESVAAGQQLTLEWHGGDENGYEVYYVPRWPGQLQYDFVTIEANTTAQTLAWTVPKLAEYPRDTEFIFGVKDGSRGPGFDWYDLSGSIPLR